MSSRSTKFAAILVAATAGAGALTAGPLLADNGRPGGGDHRNPNRAPAQDQPDATQPGQQAPFIGVVVPDPAGTDRPGPRRHGPALQPGDDNASPRVGPGGDRWQQPGARRGRSFRVTCDFVRSGMFDPIVFPGEDGMGHDHQFFGAESINPASTPAGLVAANAAFDSTSCVQVRDGSSYWMPALQITDSGSPVTVEPEEIRVRYSAPRRQRVRAFPAGFTLIAGDKSATTLQEYAGWRCEFDAPGTPLQASPPACDPDEAVVGVVRFPGCWDGTNLSSPTQAHMAYRTAGGCPTTHPVALPELTEEVFWPTDGQDHTYALSSGDAAGLHADFMNGWDQRALRNQVRRWLNRRA